MSNKSPNTGSDMFLTRRHFFGSFWIFSTLFSTLRAGDLFETFGLKKNLAPHRIGKRPHEQNREKIHRKYTENHIFLSIFDIVLGYFEGCCVFLSSKGEVFPKLLGLDGRNAHLRNGRARVETRAFF